MSPSLHIKTVVLILYGIIAVGIIGLTIPECANTTGLINNPVTNCTYQYIYCAEESSQYCVSSTNCNESYVCDTTTTTTTVIPSTQTTTTLAPNISTSTTVSTSNSNPSPADVRQHCQLGITQKYPYPNNSNYFYYCVNGILLLEQCPMCYSFNAANGTCDGLIGNCTFN